MKKIIFALVLSISTLSFVNAQKSGPPEGEAKVGEFYGGEVSPEVLKTAFTAKQLEKKLKKTNKIENVAVLGTVTEVCEKKGCWLTVKTNSKENFMVKMKDYSFFVPVALRGKNVVLEGDAEMKMTSVEDLKHFAEDAKKSKDEIAMITEPKKELSFTATGIKVIK
ncbi:DUF4920 domain-containing protein [Frigoriflavimonas asaccharolytica]|uniref:DUF4920 domain-containing protein n=1 Tax=Frigoriflavimonas asaccharolytica TaxID=2735899 RepID=A0A8J8G5Z6_9FLAO|nr:DUF4920 domain-containing protein [Frigoriflavimonas asaccharolytica]NRS91748.1 hypothetical protein [Frigoriflavimonas asaccharolytica]